MVKIHRTLIQAMFVLAAVSLVAVTGCKRESPSTPTETVSSGAGASTGLRRIDLEKPVVKIETSAGTIVLQLDGIGAPGTVRNFINYASDGFYDNTLVHYVDADKMLVAGGYSADRTPKTAGAPIRNEAHNGLKNTRGTVAMARDPSQIDSATSQFFINLVDAPQRDHTGDSADTYGYCVFGQVTEGLDVADKISHSGTADQGGDLAQTPEPPVLIKSIRVVR